MQYALILESLLAVLDVAIRVTENRQGDELEYVELREKVRKELVELAKQPAPIADDQNDPADNAKSASVPPAPAPTPTESQTGVNSTDPTA